MKSEGTPVTRLCTHSNDAIHVRGADLVEDLIGQLTFTEMSYFAITGRRPSAAETRILDAVLVTLMEHGLTPSAIAARLVYASTPESLQAGVSAGLLAVGSVFVGTMEGCARLIERILASPDLEAAARDTAEAHRDVGKPVPGFGHHLHKPDDPRTPKLLGLAEAEGVPGRHIAALRALGAAVDAVYGKHITINATGAVAALLGEIGIPGQIMRGFAVISRSAGLVAHIAEEQTDPTMRHIWTTVEKSVPYTDKPPD
ncbi:MAG: citryl-CoA lyase [Gammaproteobacteria bacterium]|nr:citryl-CoA lyase [Gammaproteobacteria bacterium]